MQVYLNLYSDKNIKHFYKLKYVFFKQSIELGGGYRRTERHLSSCDTINGARILVWSVTAAEPAPWSPISAIEDHANLHLYQITG